MSFLCAGPPVADRSPRTACVLVLLLFSVVRGVVEEGGGAESDCELVDGGIEVEVVFEVAAVVDVVVGAEGEGITCETETEGEGEDPAGGAYLDWLKPFDPPRPLPRPLRSLPPSCRPPLRCCCCCCCWWLGPDPAVAGFEVEVGLGAGAGAGLVDADRG